MRAITKPNGEVYCWIAVEQGQLRIKMNQGTAKGVTLHLDAKVIPQLKQILKEAEFLQEVT